MLMSNILLELWTLSIAEKMPHWNTEHNAQTKAGKQRNLKNGRTLLLGDVLFCPGVAANGFIMFQPIWKNIFIVHYCWKLNKQ